MKRNLKRLALAFIISTSCFLGTVLWFQAGKDADHAGHRDPVARLNESSNDVQRKPQRRVIWESVGKNDDLFPGEAIRTSANAEAKIMLIKSGTVIHLEPDSLVVLEENDKGLSLDFLQGNLFVQSTGSGAEGSDVTLKTGSGEIKLKSADMSLSKDQNGKLNLEVYKGQAELDNNGQKLALDSSSGKDRVQLLSPKAGDTVLLNLMRGEKLDLSFKPLPVGYKVAVELGASRSSMKDAGGIANGETGKITVSGKSGKWFLRVVAKAEDPALPQLASMTIPVTIEPKSPPALIEPNNEAPVLKESVEAAVEFRWMNRHRFESQVIEVSSDPQFKTSKFKQNLEGKATSVSSPLPDGNYYWRVTGFLKIGGKVEGIASPAEKFRAQSRWEIKPPSLTYPSDELRLSFSDAQKAGVIHKWEAPLGVKKFKVLVQRRKDKSWEDVLDQEVEGVLAKLPEVAPGSYQWKVSSLDPKGGPAKPSPTFRFSIADMPKIDWADASDEYQYSTPTPSLVARWKPLAQAPAGYRFKVGAGEWTPTKQTLFDVPVGEEGAHTVTVEAVNAKGQTIAQSSPREFQVKRMPLLPAPQWAQNTPTVIKADNKGNLSFGWQEVNGAKGYMMILESEDGKVIEQKEISRTTASINRLKPGQYKVKLRTLDGHQRPSQETSMKSAVVPNASDIRAPKFKNMKVK